MANALTLTAASNTVAVAGVKAGSSVNGNNSAGYTSSAGAGALDTIANAELLKGVSTTSRLYAFLNTSFASQAALDAAVAALGIVVSGTNMSVPRFVTAAPGVPTMTVTGVAAGTGTLRIALGAHLDA